MIKRERFLILTHDVLLLEMYRWTLFLKKVEDFLLVSSWHLSTADMTNSPSHCVPACAVELQKIHLPPFSPPLAVDEVGCCH